MFGLLPEAGKLQITKVTGPEFLKTYGVGELNRSTVNKVFSKTTSPLSQNQRESLLPDFDGATILYTEGYSGNLCDSNEIEYKINAIGKIDDVDIEISFQFIALPNENGDCKLHIFGIVTKYVD